MSCETPDKTLQSAAKISLKGPHFKFAADQCFDSARGGLCTGQCRIIGHLVQQGCASERAAVGQGLSALSCVEDKLNIAVLDRIDDMRTAFQNLVDGLACIPWSAR